MQKAQNINLTQIEFQQCTHEVLRKQQSQSSHQSQVRLHA